MSFGLKSAGVAFQRAMMFSFHDLKHIVEAYLYDLATHSHKRAHHLLHLHLVSKRCHFYRIRLNPHKCIFCMTYGHLLGFIVSTKGIMVDLLKVEEITQFPPPHTIRQLKSLKGKENFLRHFVLNYANTMKGFMHLLKKGVPFCWDGATQHTFDALKKELVLTPLLSPLD